jgi:hypothetical protein
MSLTFIGDDCLYLPARDAIKIRAVDGERVIDCYVTRSALDVLGCPDDDGPDLIRYFQREQDTVEIAAMVKYRRALAPMMKINVEASDLACVLPAAAA